MSYRQRRQKRWLDKWQQTPDINNYKNQDEYVFQEISRITQNLGCEEKTRTLAEQIYKQSKENGLIQGRSIDSAIAVSVMIAARQTNEGISVGDIAESTVVCRETIMSLFKTMTKELGIQVNFADPTDYLDRVFTEFNTLRNKDGLEPLPLIVKERAHEILDDARDENIISGKSPSALAGAAIYVAGKEKEENKVRQTDAANASDSSPVTIRNRFRELENVSNR